MFSQINSVYSYQLDKQNGIGSNTIYSILQKRNGLLYFAHEDGITRFNGKSYGHIPFRGRTKALSNLTEDKFGKIWARTFFGEIVFLKNDSIVIHPYSRRAKVGMPVIYKGHSSCYILERDKILRFQDNDSLKVLHVPNLPANIRFLELGKLNSNQDIVFYSSDKGLGFCVINDDQIVYQNNSVLVTLYSGLKIYFKEGDYYIKNGASLYNFSFINKNWSLTPIPCDIFNQIPKLLDIVSLGRDQTAVLTFDGLYLTDKKFKPTHFLFKGSQISGIVKSSEGDLIVGTLQEGVFVIPSLDIAKIDLGEYLLPKENIHNAELVNDSILLLGSFNGKIIKTSRQGLFLDSITLPTRSDIQSFYFDKETNELYVYADALFKIDFHNFKIKERLNVTSTKKILFYKGVLYCATSYGLIILNKGEMESHLLGNWINDLLPIYENELLISSNTGLYVYNVVKNEFKELTSVNKQLGGTITKSLKKSKDGEVFFIGVNKGLFSLNNETITELVSDGELTDFFQDKNDVVLVNNQKISFYDITKKKVVYVLDQTKGLDEEKNLKFFKSGDTYLKIGPRSIQLFKKLLNVNTKVPEINIRHMAGTFNYKNGILTSDYHKNAIEFFLEPLPNIRSGGNIKLKYRLNGADESWTEVADENSDYKIKYQLLPAGEYIFEAYAINEDGFSSTKLELVLKIRTPFWFTWWFFILEFAIVGLIIWLLYNWRMGIIKKQELQKIEAERKKIRLLSAELTAIRSQMNPHFIFNSLSSIQAKVLSSDKQVAFSYISTFSKLMRSVLDYSKEEYILLKDEIDFLRSYLFLESGRTDGVLEYHIDVEPDVDLQFLELPTLITQPFVENSIRHGLLHKEGAKHIWIRVFMQGDFLAISIKDNGIGREKAMKIKSNVQRAHRSFATEAMKSRIERINEGHHFYVEMTINDLAEGTEVVLKIKEK